jgi:hypothetical protein
MINVNVSV